MLRSELDKVLESVSNPGLKEYIEGLFAPLAVSDSSTTTISVPKLNQFNLTSLQLNQLKQVAVANGIFTPAKAEEVFA